MVLQVTWAKKNATHTQKVSKFSSIQNWILNSFFFFNVGWDMFLSKTSKYKMKRMMQMYLSTLIYIYHPPSWIRCLWICYGLMPDIFGSPHYSSAFWSIWLNYLYIQILTLNFHWASQPSSASLTPPSFNIPST